MSLFSCINNSSTQIGISSQSRLELTTIDSSFKRRERFQLAKGLLAAFAVGLVLTGCGGGGGGGSSTPAPLEHKVSASVSNLAASGLKLHLDAAGKFQDVDVKSDQTQVDFDSLAEGKAYAVSVIQNPVGQQCSIQNARGTVGTADVSNIAITCETLQSYKVSANVSSLVGSGLQLQLASPDAGVNRDAETLTVTSSGVAGFSTALPTGSTYSVSIARQPEGQNCSIAKSYGKIGKADVSDVDIACTTLPANTYKVSVGVHKDSFLPLPDLELQLSSADVVLSMSVSAGVKSFYGSYFYKGLG